jgi:hypothetical protein
MCQTLGLSLLHLACESLSMVQHLMAAYNKSMTLRATSLSGSDFAKPVVSFKSLVQMPLHILHSSLLTNGLQQGTTQ